MRRYILLLVLLTSFTTGGLTQKGQFIQDKYPEQKVSIKPDTIELHGTFLNPVLKEVPLVIIIQGSGPTDRDGNNLYMSNNSLKYLAQRLYEQGIATLRFDKRGIAESGAGKIDESTMLFEDSGKDIVAWTEYIKKNLGNFSSVTLLGHSEGALHAILTAQSYKVDKAISLAGPGHPLGDIINKQLLTQPEMLREAAAVIIDSLEAGHEVKEVDPMLFALFRPSIQPFLRSWMKYQPTKEIAKLNIPVLVIQGDNDIQVSVDNAELLHEACQDGRLVIIPEMNHILKISGREFAENFASYSDPVLPVSKDLIEHLTEFIKAR